MDPIHPQVIVAIGYGVLANGNLPDATASSIILAAKLSKESFPDALIAFASAEHCFVGCEVVELNEKLQILHGEGISPERIIYGGGITNMVTEAEAIRTALQRRGVSASEILLITDDLHGRGVMYIWQEFFPDTRLSLLYNDAHAYQADHPFPLQQRGWAWLLANALRQMALRVFGTGWVGRRQHVPS